MNGMWERYKTWVRGTTKTRAYLSAIAGGTALGLVYVLLMSLLMALTD